MELADMVLGGLVNTDLARTASERGVRAVGLTGADDRLLVGRLVADGSANRTAEPAHARPEILSTLLAAGVVPIVASVASDDRGGAVNINADAAAQAIAEALGARTLCYLSDTDGVLDGEGKRIALIGLDEIEALIDSGVVVGGMAAKIRAAGRAVAAGVGRVVIGRWQEVNDLRRLIDGDAGTTIGA